MPRRKSKGVEAPTEFVCPFCDRKFKRESTLISHKCEKRDRYNNQDTRQMREAYRIWYMFMTMYNIKMKKDIDMKMQFIKSKYFKDFYRFADYILTSQILNPEEFIKEILTSGIAINRWCDHQIYVDWVLKTTRSEHPRRGVERSINAIQEWSTATGEEWTTFFQNISTERAIFWFETGKLSPWIIYCADQESGNKLLSRLTDGEAEYLYTYLDPRFWNPLAIRYKQDVMEIRSLLKEFGL